VIHCDELLTIIEWNEKKDAEKIELTLMADERSRMINGDIERTNREAGITSVLLRLRNKGGRLPSIKRFLP
jgi:hypothetical protein